jgi:hypothetical protein
MVTANTTVGPGRVNPSLAPSAVAQTVSNAALTNSTTQAIS